MVEFEWDDDNIGHLARHGISRDEVEEVFYGRVLRLRHRTDAPDRHHILGRTASGRYLVVLYQTKARGVVPCSPGGT
jgi:uncharacterized DUF497 family protein